MKTTRLLLILIGFLLLIGRTPLTPVHATLLQLQNDNGEIGKASVAGREPGDTDAAVFFPAPELFPLTLHAVEFLLHKPQGASHLQDTARVRVHVYRVVDGVPTTVLASSDIQTIDVLDEWVSIPFADPVTVQEPTALMAAVEWRSGTFESGAPSTATDTNWDAPREDKDARNLYHDASVPPVAGCGEGFCPHSQFWGTFSDIVGYNMIRLTVDAAAPSAPTATASATATWTPTASATRTPTATATGSATPTSSVTPTPSPTGTTTPGPTPTPTQTPPPTDTATATATATRPPLSPCWVDFDHSGMVDAGDFQEMGDQWHQIVEPGSPYDLTGDQRVRVDDIALVATLWGQVCGVATPSPTPTATPSVTPTVTATPTAAASPTPTATPTPTAEVPPGKFSLTAQVFVDARCDRTFNQGRDQLLADVPVTLAFPNGASITHYTSSQGLAAFSGFDVSDQVVVSVVFPGNYFGRSLDPCPNSVTEMTLRAADFGFSRYRFVSFRAHPGSELPAP